MGEWDVLDWLVAKRKITEQWFKRKEIEEGLKAQGFTNGMLHGIWKNLIKLTLHGFIQCKVERTQSFYEDERLFRAYKKG